MQLLSFGIVLIEKKFLFQIVLKRGRVDCSKKYNLKKDFVLKKNVLN